MTDRDEGPRFPSAGIRLVYVAIADDLAAKIADGTFPPEGRLPSINDLVHQYGAARETVRKAVRELASRGLVIVVPGKGVYAAPRAPE
jgi:DNA-binding GntR family transcriptional regulator